MPYPKLEKFTIVKRVSHNAFYTQYSAIDRRSEQFVFLKLINKKLQKCKNEIAQVFVSNGILSAVAYPCISNSMSFGQDKDYLYLVSEYIDPEQWCPLSRENVSVSYSELLEIFTKIAMALRYAHLRGVVHGVLSPDCIYVGPDNAVKIDGFNFYRLIPELEGANVSLKQNYKRYIAPEVLKMDATADGQADVYSLGLILFHILSGHLPFYGNNFLTEKDHRILISAVEELFSKALVEDPEMRMGNFKDFVAEIKRANLQLLQPTNVIEVVEKELEAVPFNSNERAFENEPPSHLSILARLLSLSKLAF